MSRDKQTLEVMGLIYESVLDEGKYQACLELLADYTGSKGLIDLSFDIASGNSRNYQAVRLSSEIQAEYQAYYAPMDVRVSETITMPTGNLITEQMVSNRKTFLSSEFYGDFLLRHDIPHIMALWTIKSSNYFSALSFQRSRRQGEFGRQEQQQFFPIVPHLLRALQIREMMHSVRQANKAYMDVIHQLPFGVVFLDRCGRSIDISAAAQFLIQQGSGVRYKGGRIYATNSEDDRSLQGAIFKATKSAKEMPRVGDTVSIRRAPGQRPISISVVPLKTTDIFSTDVPRCMLIILDTDATMEPAFSSLKKILKLTDSEAHLAQQLLSGITLREAAINLELSINTCKTQLKSIYLKTGCKSHVDLAKVLSAIGLTKAF